MIGDFNQYVMDAGKQFKQGLLDFDLNSALEHLSTPQGALAMGLLGRSDQRLGPALRGALGDVYDQQAAMTNAQYRQMQMAQLQQELEANQLARQQQEEEQARMQQQFPQLAGLPQHMQQAVMKQRAEDAKRNLPFTMSPGSVYFDPKTGRPIYTAPTKEAGPGLQIAFDENGNPIIGTNGLPQGIPFGKKGANKLEDKSINAIDALANLRRIATTYQPGYLTYWGKGKAAALNVADKAGINIGADNSAFLGGAEQFKNSVDQFFNAYRKEITGAAASNAELERLKKTMINSDMGPTQFKHSFDQITRAMQQNLLMYTQLRAQGLTGEALTAAMNKNYFTLNEKLEVVPVNSMGAPKSERPARRASTLEEAKRIREERRKAQTGGF